MHFDERRWTLCFLGSCFRRKPLRQARKRARGRRDPEDRNQTRPTWVLLRLSAPHSASSRPSTRSMSGDAIVFRRYANAGARSGGGRKHGGAAHRRCSSMRGNRPDGAAAHKPGSDVVGTSQGGQALPHDERPLSRLLASAGADRGAARGTAVYYMLPGCTTLHHLHGWDPRAGFLDGMQAHMPFPYSCKNASRMRPQGVGGVPCNPPLGGVATPYPSLRRHLQHMNTHVRAVHASACI